jgi:tetratricopeptide (TPR) repeat protein
LTPPPHDTATGVDRAGVPDEQPTILDGADRTVMSDAPPTVLGGGDRTVVFDESATVLADANQTRLAPAVDARGRPATEDPAATRLAATPTPPPPVVFADTDDHGPLAVGQTFGNRYHIIRLLGIGGMGAVYQAWDAELAVSVALKVIRPEVMADPKTAAEIEKRFKRELLLARQVTHRNVVRIHDLGDIGGIKYITMSYVEGSDLASVLRQEGRLSPVRALKIVRSVVSGLVEAHKAGVVHRDLKPANIMIDEDDQALIMDFGIARSTGRPTASVPGNTTIVNNLKVAVNAPADATVLGSVIGTVEYMAPEQARGEHIDQRADIYALGLIIYDMLVGQPRAKRAGSAIAELQARMEKAPPTVKSLVPEVPLALDQLVSRCLEPDPAKRYQTTQELAEALTWINDKGERIRVRRVVGMRLFAAAIVLGLGLLAGTWWFARGPALPVQHDPVSVLIADFDNQSKDSTFDGTLEPIVKVALEGAGFISAYDRAGIARSLGVKPPEKLDEQSAQQIAVKQGVGVILAGSVSRQGDGYTISVKASHAVTGAAIANASNRAASKDQVLGVATRLAETVRKALGDNTSDNAQRFAMDTLSATSVEAIRDYAAGQVAISNSDYEGARQNFQKAVDRDPKFGMGWTALAMAERNLDRHQDAAAHVAQAISHIDSMTERERYRTRGLSYMITNDYDSCVKEYRNLVEKYAGDASARNNLALCLTYLRKMPEAVKEMEQVVKILPNRRFYRENLALYASYAGDFAAGEREARALQEPSMFGLLALAFAQLGQGQLTPATETYRAMGRTDAQGASYMASGLADLAIYEGRYSDAANILEAAAATDVGERDADRAAAKYVALAYARLMRRELGPATAAADKALAHSNISKIRYLAARIYVEAGKPVEAKKLATALATELQAAPQAYAKLIEGAALLKSGDARGAIKPLDEANNKLLDTWLGRFDLGRAYLEAGAFLQADSEFDLCIKRRGEALSLFLDEEPTFGYLPPVYYYQGRVRQELKTAAFADSYRTYIAIRGKSTEDRLVPEARKYTK